MKQHLQKLGKFFFLSTLMLFLGCQAEEATVEQQNFQEKELNYKKVTFSQINSENPKILELLGNTVSTVKSSKFNRKGPNADNSYLIDSTTVVYMNNGDYTSYTFSVIPDEGASILQNIVIATDNSEVHSLLAEYEMSAPLAQVQQNEMASYLVKSSFYPLENPNLEYGKIDVGNNQWCVVIGHYELVDRCQGELVSSGDLHCFNPDGTKAQDKVFIVGVSACSESGGGSGGSSPEGPGSDYPGTGNPSNGSGNGGIGTGPGGTPGTGTPGTGNPPLDGTQNPGEGNPGNGSGSGNIKEQVLVTQPVYVPVPPRTLSSFISSFTTQQKNWLNNTNNSIALASVSNFATAYNYNDESIAYIATVINACLDYIENYGNSTETNVIANDFVESLLDDNDIIDAGNTVLDIAPDCDSFQFINTASNWQMSAVSNIHFVVTLINQNGASVSHVVDYPRPILFGCPRNLAVGNTTITPGMAASLSATALYNTMRQTSRIYGNKRVSWTMVHLGFEKILKKNYKDYVPGGRVDPHPQNYPANVIPTLYQSSAYGDNDCE